jgi:hypothetical protein
MAPAVTRCGPGLARIPVFFRGPAISLSSQAAGLLQFVLILYRVGAGIYSDTYLYCFTLGALPGQILFTGLMYPRILNRQDVSPSTHRVLRSVALFASVALVVSGGLWTISYRGRRELDLLLLIALLAFNALLQSALLFRATLAAADGRPSWIAGLALPANAAAVVSLSIPTQGGVNPLVYMMIAMVLGNSAHLFYSYRRQDISLEDLVLATSDETASSPRPLGGGRWYFARSTASYITQAFLQSAAASLPTSAVTNLSVATKVATIIPTAVVNSTFPRVINARTTSPMPSRVLGRKILAGSALMAAFILLALVLTPWIPPYLVVATSLWAIFSTSSATSQHMSFRFLQPTSSLVSIGTNVAVVVAVYILTFVGDLSIAEVLIAYVLIDALNATTIHWMLGDRAQAAGMAVFTVIALAVPIIF